MLAMSDKFNKPTFEILGLWEGGWDTYEHTLQQGLQMYLNHRREQTMKEIDEQRAQADKQ